MCDNLKTIFCRIADATIAKCKTNSGNIIYKTDSVPAQYVAIIEVALSQQAGHLKYIKEAITEAPKREALHKKLLGQSELPTIALVLESPHIEEYNNDLLCPLIGSSENVQQQFLQLLLIYLMLNNSRNSAFISNRQILSNGRYRLLFINPIQYQCSLGLTKKQRKEKLSKDTKKIIFQECWQKRSFQTDFVGRLKCRKPIMIINCCTGKKGGNVDGLQRLVQDVIDKHFCNTIRLTGYHPSSPYFNMGFTEWE